jgi:hypothetical protein
MTDASLPWYLQANFLPAAFGLIGVIVGGTITAISSYFLERSKEKRSQERDLRRAARIMTANLSIFQSEVSSALNTKKWPPDPALVDYPSPLWVECQSVLAGSLSPTQWRTLVIGLMVVESFHRIIKEAMPLAPDKHMIPDATLNYFKTIFDKIAAASACLEEFTGSLH